MTDQYQVISSTVSQLHLIFSGCCVVGLTAREQGKEDFLGLEDRGQNRSMDEESEKKKVLLVESSGRMYRCQDAEN